MKKLFAIMLALPLFLASCSDDDLPDVNFSVAYSGATAVDGTLYAVQGTPLAFTSISVEAVNASHRAAITNANYYWDGIPAGGTIVEPFARQFDTSLYSVGDHFVQIQMGVVEVDRTPAMAVLTIPVKIVASADDIPGATGGDEPQSGVLNPVATIGD